MRSSITRKVEAAAATLAPDEAVVEVGRAWVFADSGRVPKLFRARRRCVVARTERRLLVWRVPSARDQLVGTRPVLGAPLDQLTVEGFARARVLAALRLHTTAGATVVLELTPRERRFGGRLVTAIDAATVAGGSAAVGQAATDAVPPPEAAPPVRPPTGAPALPAITRGEVLKVVTDLRDGRLAPEAARAWAVAVGGSPVAGTDVAAPDRAWIGDIVAALAAPAAPADGPSPTIDRHELDGWVARLSSS
ncbi:MAG: hypothetical protein JWL73_1681 [Actinomycetia bacterium]|nr:hypothetical protein [Actinomycetes bacterium]